MSTKGELEDLFNMTASRGWDLLVKDCGANIERIKDILTDPQQAEAYVHVLQGRVAVYRELLSFRNSLEIALTQLAEDNEVRDE